MVFDVDTDGQQTQQEIEKLIKDALSKGSINGYTVSPEGYDFRLVRTCKFIFP